MKTAKSSSKKMKAVITGFTLMVITALFFASCKKEELQQPSSAQTATENERQVNLAVVPKLLFTSIEVDHVSYDNRTPDYDIVLFSNGTVNYIGRKNVHIRGKYTFKVSAETLGYINSLCMLFNAAKMSDDKNESEIINLRSFVNTKVMSGNYIVINCRDLNNGNPEWLVNFRTKVENAIDLSKHIRGDEHFPKVVAHNSF